MTNIMFFIIGICVVALITYVAVSFIKTRRVVSALVKELLRD